MVVRPEFKCNVRVGLLATIEVHRVEGRTSQGSPPPGPLQKKREPYYEVQKRELKGKSSERWNSESLVSRVDGKAGPSGRKKKRKECLESGDSRSETPYGVRYNQNYREKTRNCKAPAGRGMYH